MVYTSDLSPDGFGYESSSLSSGTRQLPLTLNDRGLRFERDGVSLILTWVANFMPVWWNGIHISLRS